MVVPLQLTSGAASFDLGRFDANDLDRDVVYLYQPGDGQDVALVASGGELSTVTDVAQQPAFAYPG